MTKTIPRGLLSFKTLSNSIAECGHEYKNNLIATNFTMLEAVQHKTVLNILEAKLFKDLVSYTVPTVHKVQAALDHDNNSYLYGSWLSDTVSQEMYLVSLKNDHHSQGSLVDSVHWWWEQTLANELEDEDIISNIVHHLELSKNEFWTDTTVTELHSIDSDSLGEDDKYNPSFIDDFFSTQNDLRNDNSIILQATNLTHSQVTNTPSTNYSPDLFSNRKHSGLNKTHIPGSLPFSLLAKSNMSGHIPCEDESMNSPSLFGEDDHNKTPIHKMNGPTDFTSPPLC